MPFQEEPRAGRRQQGAGALAAGGVRGRARRALRLDAEEDAQRLPRPAGERGRGEGASPELARGHAVRGEGRRPPKYPRRGRRHRREERQTRGRTTPGETAMGTRSLVVFRKTPLEGCRSRVPSPATWWARPSRHQAKYPGVSRADGLPAPSCWRLSNRSPWSASAVVCLEVPSIDLI